MVYDQKGIPIYPGDLLRTYHFTGARRKKYWLYHVAVQRDNYLYMVPTSHLADPTGGGDCHLNDLMAANCQIISGHGPGTCLSFEDRPRL